MSDTNPLVNLFADFDKKPEPSVAAPVPNLFETPATQADAETSASAVPNLFKSTTPAPAVSPESVNLFKKPDVENTSMLSDEERQQSQRPDPENQIDEPWYSKTWDWLNKPLWDLHQYGVRTGAGTFERGIESGVEDIVSGLTSPLSIGLAIATLGGGTIAEGTAAGLRTLGVAAEDAPVVARGMKTLMDAGFTVQQIHGLATQSPQFLDALKDGDYENATRLGTNILAGGAMATHGARKGFEDAAAIKDYVSNPNVSETLTTAKKIAGQLDEERAVASQKAREVAQKIKDRLKSVDAEDEITQGAIRKYMVAGGDIQLLKNQHDALAGALPVRDETPVEKEVREQGIELKKWLGNSKAVDANGKPTVLFAAKGPAGSEGLGTILTTDGDADQGRFARIVRSKDFGNRVNLENSIEQLGGEQNLKAELRRSGFDSLKYTGEDGKPVFVTLNADQVRPAEQLEAAAQKMWNQDFLYHATDVKNADLIRNSGIKGPKQKVAWYANTPEEALKSGVTPVSGNREDLHVFAVPRDEVESAVAKSGFRPDKSDVGSRDVESGKFIATNQTHMPSHEVVLDDEGKPTGRVVPLRGDVPLTLDNTRFNSEYTDAEKAKLLAIYKKAQDLTPEQQAVAKMLRRHYDTQFDKAHGAGIIREAVENYHPQAWANDKPSALESLFGMRYDHADNTAFNQLRHQTDNGAFDTNVAAAKHRAFETEFQGEMAGYRSKSNDLAYHAADYQAKLDRAIAARQFLERMRASGARAADGRPLVALSGSSRVVGEESGKPALLTNPNAVRQIAISNDMITKMQEAGDLESLLARGIVEKLPWTKDVIDEKTGETRQVPAFAWNTDGYQTIDHPSMRGWQYTGKDTAGNPALLKAQMRVHPEAAEYVRQVVGADVSKFRTNPYLRALMAAQRETKGALLSFSPFHAVQEGLRGVMLGINPFDASPVDVVNDPVLRLGVRNNLTFPDYRAQDMFSDGVASHSRLIGKIPVLGKLQEQIQSFTFEKLIPSLKARAFKSVFERFREKMPEASADQVAHEAATYVNDVFGGQHWRDLGASATTQDVMRAVALAPDWLTSEVRMLWRAAGGMGKPGAAIARADMTRLVAGMFVTARVINMLSTGKPHPEAPFGLVQPGKKGEPDKVYSLRTLPTDLVHVMTNPRDFVMGRVNPLIVRTAIEGLTQRDQFGRKVTGQQEFTDTFRNFVPIGVQGLLRGNTGDLTNRDQAVKALGGTAYAYKSEAEKLASEKASDHMPSGPIDPDQLEAHQRIIHLEDGLRDGTITRGQVYRALGEREAAQVIQNASLTPLQARFNRLPLRDAIDVWNIATPSEKDSLSKLLWQKRVAYVQSHTPAQRRDDPVWRKLQNVMADIAYVR